MDWEPFQLSFVGGEVSPDQLNRADTEEYASSALRMLNWQPRIQGPAQRSPGSFFLELLGDTADKNARIIPFLDSGNVRALAVFTDLQMRVIPFPESPVLNTPDPAPSTRSTTGYRKQIIDNWDYSTRENWTLDPVWFRGEDNVGNGARYARTAGPGEVEAWANRLPRTYGEVDTVSVRARGNVDIPTDVIKILYGFRYSANFEYTTDPENHGQMRLTLRVGTTEGGNDVYERIWTENDIEPGDTLSDAIDTDILGAGFTGDIYVEWLLEALQSLSTPIMAYDFLGIEADAAAPAMPEDVPSPYAGEDLNLLQYVQSPYDDKDVVVVHPDYPPQRIYYDAAGAPPGYVIEPITFTGAPSEWLASNYPSACTAYQGRLVLGGTPNQGETVWMSKPGDWFDFTIDTNPDSGIAFTTIFRSPIQWMYGHKDLIIGTRDMEYVVQSDTGLVQPGDIDVRQHSPHGSVPIQPAPMSDYIAFATERANKVRSIYLDRDSVGWIAPELSYRAQHMFVSGAKRLARVRNPHQMLAVLTENGTIRLLHEERYLGLNGWSELDLGGNIIDICSMPDSAGADVLYAVVRRSVSGVDRLCLEAIFNWTDSGTWRYTNSHVLYSLSTPSSTLTGLGHLEGQFVQVTGLVRDDDAPANAGEGYLGIFQVSGGEVQLTDPLGEPLVVSVAMAGLPQRNLMVTLPPVVPAQYGGLGSKKRFTEVNVRALFSTRVLINGEAPAERNVITRMDTTEPLTVLDDVTVTNLGQDTLALIRIEEPSPLRAEMIAIHGKLASKSV